MTIRIGTNEIASQIPPVLVFLQGVVGLALDLGHHLLAIGQGLLDHVDFETMDLGPGVGERIRGLMEIELRLADLHPLFFGLGERFVGLMDPVFEVLEIGMDGLGGLGAGDRGAVLLLALLVAADAEGAALACPENRPWARRIS